VTAAIRHHDLGPLAGPTADAIAELQERDAVRRMWAGDHTLWADDPTELADRLGWLRAPGEMGGALDEIAAVVAGCQADGLTDVVVMGMGGSSLFPEVLARSFPPTTGGLRLHVLDSTDPAAVGRVAALDPATTLYVSSSKSGTTIETRSHLEFFWDHVARGDRFVAITDPGSELAALATERGFRHVFENRPDIGGRYSALSYFGLVPAALAGLAWTDLVDRAVACAPSLQSNDPAVNVGLQLGAAMAAGVRVGRDKLTFAIDPRIGAFGLWLEQLIAESTGKAGLGVVPVADEPLAPLDEYGADRMFVGIGHVEHPTGLEVLAEAGHPVIWLSLDDPLDLGAQVLVWEVATALCGALLGTNPFDQPDVAAAKAATARVLADGAAVLPSTSLAEVLGTVRPGDYLSLQAYVDPLSSDVGRLEELRLELRDRYRMATTFGLGPRFLHSTGQLHKGGPPTGVFLQVVGHDPVDAVVPGQPFTFGQLKRAQADGDLLTLSARGLRVARTSIAELLLHLDEPGVG
jgi:glucose-6-phosphate isomerase